MNSICVFGDSVAKGVIFDDMKQKYSLLKENFIELAAREAGIPIKNFACFGATTFKGRKIMEQRYSQLCDADYTILEFGGNDCNLNWKSISKYPLSEHDAAVPLEIFLKTYEEMIETTIEAGSRPILLTLPPLDSERFFDWVSKDLDRDNILKFLGNNIENITLWHQGYNEMIEALADEYGLIVLDIRKPIEEAEDPASLICCDGMHPNAKGHEKIAHYLAMELGKLQAFGPLAL